MAHPPVIQRLIDAYHKNTGKKKRNTEFSRKWFKDRISKNIKSVRLPQMVTEKSRNKSKPVIGKMYMYVYDAKHKDTLPIWDAMPLIFFVGPTKDNPTTNFHGVNLHFLPPKIRLAVFTELLRIRSEKRYREKTKLALSYNVLQRFSNSKYLMHSFREYRYDHLRTKFILVPADEWEIALFLPTARFQKGGKSEAWAIP